MSTAIIQAAIGGAPAEIVYDGQYHRFQVEGSKRRAGWYIANLRNGLPIIKFGSWTDHSKYSIRGDEIVDPDARRRQQFDHHTDSKTWKQKRTAEFANTVWNASNPCLQHPYSDKKRIHPSGLKVLELSRIPKQSKNWFAGYAKKYGLDGAMIVPMMIGDKIVDLQFITTANKIFLPNGNHNGAYFTLGKPTDSDKIVIATGYATSKTLHDCLESIVYCVFSDSNIDAATRAIKLKHPKHTIIIAADNDIHSDEKAMNSGVVYSTAAAKKYDLLLAIPELNGTKVDYNDLFIALGKQAVIESIQAAVSVNSATLEISAKKAGELLELALDDWLDSTDHAAIKAPAGLGKSTRLLQRIVRRRLRCDYFVPSYELAIEQANRLPLGMAIAIRGRSHKTAIDQPLCAKWESVEVLNKIGLAHKTMPLLCGKIDPTTGKRPCPYSKGCGYLNQFHSTAPIRFYAHEYLPLDNGQLTQREIDVAVIDETFHDSLEKIKGWSISELMTQPESVYRELVTAIIENRLLEMNHLLEAMDDILKTEVEIESHLHPEMDFNTAVNKVKPLIEARRKPIGFIWNCKKAIELNTATRLFVGQHDRSMIFASYAKPIQFIPKETPTAYLDASLVEGIVKNINPQCRMVKIEATRQAKIVQITDSSMSTKRLLDDHDFLSSRLLHFIQAQVKINPNGAVIAPMKWIEAHQDRFPESVKLAHFGGLRGLNTLENCDWLVQIGRNQPPPHAVEAVARAWWPSARLTLTGAYISQERTLTAKNGAGALVWMHTHADLRCREVLEAMREQESLQALDRLRLIHSKVKQVWLFCNLPLPGIEPDELATLDGLTLPGRLAEVALRDSVVVTGRKELHERHPDIFPTEKAARREVRTWQENTEMNGPILKESLFRNRPIENQITDIIEEKNKYENKYNESNDIEIRNQAIYPTVNYRLDGQPGGKLRTAIIPYGEEGLEARLEAIHGKPVKIMRTPEQQLVSDLCNSGMPNDELLLALLAQSVKGLTRDELLRTLCWSEERFIAVKDRLMISGKIVSNGGVWKVR